MTDYLDLVQRLRRDEVIVCGPEDFINGRTEVRKSTAKELEAAYAIEAQAKRIAELEHQLKVECDTYLWKRKLMSRRIAFLQGWMKELFKYCSSPNAKRNHFTMTTEIPDALMREGENLLFEATASEKIDE